MCTDCFVNQHEVVAIVLEDVAGGISSPCHEVKAYMFLYKKQHKLVPHTCYHIDVATLCCMLWMQHAHNFLYKQYMTVILIPYDTLFQVY